MPALAEVYKSWRASPQDDWSILLCHVTVIVGAVEVTV